MWDTATGQGRLVLGPQDLGSYVHDLALSPDGSRPVTAHNDGTVKVWSVKKLLGQHVCR
jgi:WD40 repeat protein